ncbi:MAG: prolipoprotein diacylglyceryl transferase [Clostridia bacterium]|nr:prolipoprotein diacylglyceryl transferase [Clostridia bacterium]
MNNLLWFFFIPDYIDKSHNFISIFGFHIYFYAIAITFGMIVCVLTAIPLFKRRGENPDFLLDLMIGVIPCSIILARLFYVLFGIDEFIIGGKFDFMQALNIRDGGLAIYGGVAGGALGIFIVCKIRKKSTTKIFDFGAVMLPLGQAIGRWGNYFNQEVYGAVDPLGRGLPISVYIQNYGEYHYALFLWESIANLILFGLLFYFLFNYKGKRNGYTTSFYFMGYGLIRLIMEPMRDPRFNLPLFGIEGLGMWWTSLALIIGGISIFTVIFIKDFKACGKNFKAYFTYMFGEKKQKKAAEGAVQEDEKESLPVKRISADKKTDEE